MFVVTLSRHVMSCISPGIYIFPYFPTEINVYRISTAITLMETGQGPSMCNSFRHILKVSLKKKILKLWMLPSLFPYCRFIKKVLHYFPYYWYCILFLTLFYSPLCSILHLTELKTFRCPRGGLTFFLINFWLSLSGFTKQNFTGFLHSLSLLTRLVAFQRK